MKTEWIAFGVEKPEPYRRIFACKEGDDTEFVYYTYAIKTGDLLYPGHYTHWQYAAVPTHIDLEGKS